MKAKQQRIWGSTEYTRKRHLLRTGDIILFSGSLFHDKAVEFFTRSQYSHVEIIFEAYGHFFTIGAVGSGVRVERLGQKMIEHYGHAKIVRATLSFEQQQKVAAAALNHCGQAYDWPSIWNFYLHRIFPAFQWHAPNLEYCSELVAEALEEAGYTQWTYKDTCDVTPGDYADSIFFEHVTYLGLNTKD